jgi:WD40 repeat protein
MSTDLYGVRILGLDPAKRQATLRVFVVYYDVQIKRHQPLPDDSSFFLRILTEPVREGDGALCAVLGRRKYDEAFVDSNAWRWVERVRRLEARNETISDWSAFHDFYYERDGRWSDEEKLVQADYELTVSDAKWLAHWKKGQSWGTASYPTEADRLSAAEAELLPDFRLEARRLTPFDGEQESGTPQDAFFSDDGALLAVTSQSGGAVVYDTKSWKETMRIPKDVGLFPHAEFFPRTHVLAMRVGFKDEAQVWNADDGTPETAELPPGRVRSRSGTLRAELGESNRLRIFDEKGVGLRTIETPHPTCEAAAFSPDETAIATAGMNDEVVVWRIKDGERLRGFRVGPEDDRISHLDFSPDGRFLMVSGSRAARIVDAADGRVLRARRSPDTYPCEIAWSGSRVSVVHVGRANGYGGWISIHEVGATWPSSEETAAAPTAPRPKKSAAAMKKAKPKTPAKRKRKKTANRPR